MIKKSSERLAKIGINFTYMGNYPWIYLDTVNRKKVKGTFMANHGFSAFILEVNGNYIPKTIKIVKIN